MEAATVAFCGAGSFGDRLYRALAASENFRIAFVVTRPDRPAGRGQNLRSDLVAESARSFGHRLLQPNRLSNEHAGDFAGVDVAVVASYGALIPEAILSQPRRGFVNVHPSLLPAHRGASPIAAAILANDARTGVTIMLMDRGLDTGPLLRQEAVDLPATATRLELEDQLAKLGGRLLVSTLTDYLADRLTPTPQPPVTTPVSRRLSRKDGRVDWTQPADTIERQYRALTPWPGLWTTYRGEVLKLHGLRPQPDEPVGKPGQVSSTASEPMRVRCGRGSLEILALQREGRSVLSAAVFIRGYPGLIGNRLGT